MVEKVEQEAFKDPGALALLPTQRLRDFFMTIADGITVFSVEQLKSFTFAEKAALVNHPFFNTLLAVFKFDIAIGLARVKPAQMTAIRLLSHDMEEDKPKRGVRVERKVIEMAPEPESE